MEQIAPAYSHISAEKCIDDHDTQRNDDSGVIGEAEGDVQELSASDDLGGCVDDHEEDHGDTGNHTDGAFLVMDSLLEEFFSSEL